MSSTPWYAEQIENMSKELVQEKQKNAELLEALKELIKLVPIANETEAQDKAKWSALAAITKAEGGS